MIVISKFDGQAGTSLSFYGKVNTPQIKKQAYSRNRTIGNRLKQRWINTYTISTVEILAIDIENKEFLEDMFYEPFHLSILDTESSVETFGYLVGDTLALAEFVDADGNMYWRGSLEIEQ
ncbi:MAG: hypothetical protein ACRC6B_09520 [Fusobacteriaceae bacterium]